MEKGSGYVGTNCHFPEFMGLVDRNYLRHAIKKGLANSSMPAWENVLSEEQVDLIIQYISEAFHVVK